MIDKDLAPLALPGQAVSWLPRSAEELLRDQLRAIDAWNAARAIHGRAASATAESRDQKLEASRRLDALRAEQAALLALADAQLDSGRTWLLETSPRVVVAHRQDWFRERVIERLEERGALVLASVDDGAAAVAAAVFEQPDLLIAEELLPTLTGLEVLQRVREFAPMTAVGLQYSSPGSMAQLLDAGAALVCSRRIPPADLVVELLSCLHQRESSRSLV